MTEFPTPVWPFANLPAASMLQPVRPIARFFSPAAKRMRRLELPSLPPTLDQRLTIGFDVTWARHQDEVREAQRLRHSVFAAEMGARLIAPVPGHDIDYYDDFCEHLLVRDRVSGAVISTYRLLTPAQAKRAGGLYADAEFDLTPLAGLRPRMVELSRSCMHAAYRRSSVILALWGALGQFMKRDELDVMVATASIPMLHNGVVGGDVAASIWRQLASTHLAPPENRVQPRLQLPIEQLDDGLDVDLPTLIKGYLRPDGKVLGPPAWDPDINSADVPMMVRLFDMQPRYRRHFLGW